MGNIRAGLALLGLLATCAVAGAADEEKTYALKEGAPVVGTMLKRNVVTGPLPMTLRYEQMSPEQREVVKSSYEPMPPDDEPPFPADGLAPVMKALHKAGQAYYVEGLLDLAVEIGPDGRARNVVMYAAPDDPGFRKFALSVAMLTHYKPAICAGKPCTMSWPLRIEMGAR